MQENLATLIKERVDLPALIGQKVRLQKSGGSFKGLCPFHAEKSPSFHVYGIQDSNRFICFSCGEKGDCFDWVQFNDGLDFAEALRYLGEMVGVEVPAVQRPPENPALTGVRELLLSAQERYVRYFSTKHGDTGRVFLGSKGLQHETIEEFGVGLCPNIPLPGEGQFKGRLMFPLHDELGQLVGFAGRTLTDAKPKYINSSQGDLFDKGSLLYNLNRAKRHIRRAGAVLVMEGYTDVLMAAQHGYGHVVATMGTAMTEAQAKRLALLKTRVILCLDGDNAGQLASERGIKQLLAQGKILGTTYVAVMPRGKDPADLLRTAPDQFKALVDAPVPVISYLIQRWAKPVETQAAPMRSLVVARLGPLLRDVADPVERDIYIRELAAVIGTSFEAVFAAVMQRKSMESVPPRRPLLVPFNGGITTTRAFAIVDREILALGLMALRPDLARKHQSALHGSFFLDLRNNGLYNELRDALRYHTDITTTTALLDTLHFLEDQESLTQAIDQTRTRFPLVEANEDVWLKEVLALGKLLQAHLNESIRQQLVNRLPGALETQDTALVAELMTEIRKLS